MEYCFLNCVHVTQDDISVVYEIVQSTKQFNNVRISWVDLNGLKELAQKDGFIRDFRFEDGFLRCSSNVPRVRIFGEIETACREHIVKTDLTESPRDTIFTMLWQGVGNNFCFVPDDLAEVDVYIGDGITPFSNVKFSQSSMSIYFREILNGTIKNKYLVKSEGTIFKFVPFYFIVPEDYKEPISGKFVKRLRVNNTGFLLYYADKLSLIEPIKTLPAVLFNKAVCLRARLKSAITLLNGLIEPYNGSKLKWVGENSKEHKLRMMEFKSSYTEIPKSAVNELLDVIKPLIRKTFQESKEAINMQSSDVVFRFAAQMVASTLHNSETTADLISNCRAVIKQLSIEIFYIDLYLYRIQSFAFKTDNNLFKYSKKCFYGSNEPGFTLVEEVVK